MTEVASVRPVAGTTTEMASVRPVAAVVVSAIVVFLIAASHSRPNVREGWTLVAAIVKFAIVASMIPDVLAGRVHVTTIGTFVPGVELAFRADPLGMLFAVVASGLYVLTAVYSIGYVRGLAEHGQTRFFAALAGSLSAAIGVAFASNLLVLLVCYELLTVATYPLVAHEESTEARLAGYKYLTYAFSGGIVIFVGVLLVFWLGGTIDFTPGGIPDLATADPWAGRAAFGILVAGFGVKAAIMPLHAWLPSAMVAPTPVSGLLHAVAVVKAGAFAIARTVIDVFGPETIAALGVGLPLVVVAAGTILAASLLALRQDNLKRRLAYSTIAQLSYIVLGVALLSPAALAGGLLHLPAHAFAKLTLFLCAGALYVELDLKQISSMAGVGRRMPLTMTAFGVASLSMAGIPLLAGFVSKWYLLIGGIEAGHLFVVGVLVASGALNVAYFWPIVYTAFFETPADADPKPVIERPIGGRSAAAHPDGGRARANRDDRPPGTDRAEPSWERRNWRGGETTGLLLVPLLGTALLTIAFGVAPDHLFFLDAVGQIVEAATGVTVP